MELRTKVNAEDGKQELQIIREFNLPAASLYKAYEIPEIFEQWMGTKVLKWDFNAYGHYAFETSDPQGNVVFKAQGCIHECIPNHKITRTFQMADETFDTQLEFLEFEEITATKSMLRMQIIFRSVEMRNQLLQRPFAYGLNYAHNQLEEVASQLK